MDEKEIGFGTAQPACCGAPFYRILQVAQKFGSLQWWQVRAKSFSRVLFCETATPFVARIGANLRESSNQVPQHNAEHQNYLREWGSDARIIFRQTARSGFVADKNEIIRLLKRGLSFRRIQEQVGGSKGNISYHAKKLGLSKRELTYYDWQAIQEFHDAGHSRLECIAEFGFSPAAWSDAVKSGRLQPRDHRIPLDELLSEGRNTQRTHLKGRLVNAGLLEQRCYRCGMTEWQGEPISLELHHIDGNGKNNRLENLQLLCPNCHSQTDNWGGKNRKK